LPILVRVSLAESFAAAFAAEPIPTLYGLGLSDLSIDVNSMDSILGDCPVDTPTSPLLPGTLDLLILKTLSVGAMHGYGIAQHIHRLSGEALRVEEGSLYPALQRMQVKGWVTSELRATPTGRRGRYYSITRAGRKQLGEEEASFLRSVSATNRVLRGATS
jgi:transcriptional regulator